jgi:chaperonin GroEL
MVKAGIIDPLKVIRTALVDAARFACFPVLSLLYHVGLLVT